MPPSLVKIPARRIQLIITCDLFDGSPEKQWNMHCSAANLIAPDGFPLQKPVEIPSPPIEFVVAALAEYVAALTESLEKLKAAPEAEKAQQNVPMVQAGRA